MLGAWREFRKGKTKKKDIQKFEFNLESNIFSLHNELVNKTYTNQPYISFYVYDPKRRHIHKSQVRDRVVHQVIYRVLYHVYDKSFIHDSYSCRVGKGTHKGVQRLEDFIRKESKNYTRPTWVLKCDISKFFDSIDHSLLQNILFKNYIDENTKWLIKNIIQSFEKSRGKGLPLGNVTSQLFSNIYLNEFDQHMKHRLKAKYYIRYADDFVVISHDKRYLESLIVDISLFLKERLNLPLHPRKVEIRKVTQGIDFLGYIILPHYKVLRTNTKRRILKKARRKLSNETLQSYLGIISHCNGYKLKKVLIER